MKKILFLLSTFGLFLSTQAQKTLSQQSGGTVTASATQTLTNKTISGASNTITNIPISAIASGTPDGTKFVRDDGTLAVPAGGGGGSMVYPGAGIPVSTGSAWGTSLTHTTVGENILALTNPSAVRFLRINADNTVTPRTAAELLSDIGAQASGSYQPLSSNLTTYAGITPSANVQTLLGAADYAAFKTSLSLNNVTNESKATMFSSPTFTGTVSGVTASHVGLGNVTNESKATMFTSPTFTGNAVLGAPASGDFSSGTFTWPTFNQNTSGTAAGLSATLGIGSGGTGQTSAGAAMNALLPIKTGNGGKFLRVNAGETDWEVAAIAGGGDALTSGTLGQFASTTSAQLGTVLSDETGSAGGFVRATGPTITTPSINNITGSYTTTATAAGTTTLTSSSTYLNVFTGATTQTVVMPDATTLAAGLQYQVTNNSTGVVTVNKNGGTLLKALAANTSAIFTVTDISTSAGGWYIEYSTDLAIGSATGNDLTLASETPSTPAADNMKLFAYKIGGRVMPGYIDPAGLDNAIQPLFARNGIKKWLPSGNGTAIVADGAAALTATGTATAASVATTNRHKMIRGLEYLVTAAATTAVAGFREGANQQFFGNSAGNGGFFLVCRFGPATGVATTTNRCFVGMTTSTGAPTDVEPSTLTNMFGVGWDAADANIQFMNNDGSGTATKTSLDIAVPTADRTSVYELAMFCAPNSTTVYYTFKDLAEGGSSVSGNVSSDIPAVNTLFSARGWMSVGGTSSVIGIALKSLYIETDY